MIDKYFLIFSLSIAWCLFPSTFGYEFSTLSSLSTLCHLLHSFSMGLYIYVFIFPSLASCQMPFTSTGQTSHRFKEKDVFWCYTPSLCWATSFCVTNTLGHWVSISTKFIKKRKEILDGFIAFELVFTGAFNKTSCHMYSQWHACFMPVFTNGFTAINTWTVFKILLL